MKNLKYILGAFVVAFTMASCEKDTPIIEPPVDELEAAPTIEAPGAGKITLAVRVPKNTCNGIYGVGTINGWDIQGATTEFTKVEGTETWYSFTFDFASDAAVKVVAIPESASRDWIYQWGMNKEGEAENVTFVSNSDVTIDNTENGGEVKLTFGSATENQVVFLDVKAWKSEPCKEPVPAGNGKFIFTPADGTVIEEGASVIFTGNFTEKSWGESDRTMTKNGNNYEWTGDYPQNFQMKVFKVVDGSAVWMQGDNVTFDGTLPFTFSGTF